MSITTKTGLECPTLQELITTISGDLNTRLASIQSTTAKAALYPLRLLTPVLAAVMAAVAYLLYQFIDFGINQFFIQHCSNDTLDLWGEIWNLHKKTATIAGGNITVSGTVGKVIPVGRQLTREDGQTFEVITEAIIDSGETAIVAVEALEAGIAGNCEANEVLTFTNPLAGIESASIVDTDGITGGLDIESEASHRQRLLERTQNPPKGGTLYDHKLWALQAEHIDQCWPQAMSPDPGFVTIPFTTQTGADGPLPDGGGAYNLEIAVVGLVTYKTVIEVLKTELETALGRPAIAGWFADGQVFYDITGYEPSETAMIQSAGIQSDGDKWLIPLTVELDEPPQAGELLHLLCPYTVEVRDEIYHTDTETDLYDRKPSEATVLPVLPMPVNVTLTIDLENSTTELQDAIEAEIKALFKAMGEPNHTISNWQINAAIAAADGHTGHDLDDVAGDGPLGNVNTGANEIPILTSITWS